MKKIAHIFVLLFLAATFRLTDATSTSLELPPTSQDDEENAIEVVTPSITFVDNGTAIIVGEVLEEEIPREEFYRSEPLVNNQVEDDAEEEEWNPKSLKNMFKPRQDFDLVTPPSDRRSLQIGISVGPANLEPDPYYDRTFDGKGNLLENLPFADSLPQAARPRPQQVYRTRQGNLKKMARAWRAMVDTAVSRMRRFMPRVRTRNNGGLLNQGKGGLFNKGNLGNLGNLGNIFNKGNRGKGRRPSGNQYNQQRPIAAPPLNNNRPQSSNQYQSPSQVQQATSRPAQQYSINIVSTTPLAPAPTFSSQNSFRPSTQYSSPVFSPSSTSSTNTYTSSFTPSSNSNTFSSFTPTSTSSSSSYRAPSSSSSSYRAPSSSSSSYSAPSSSSSSSSYRAPSSSSSSNTCFNCNPPSTYSRPQTTSSFSGSNIGQSSGVYSSSSSSGQSSFSSTFNRPQSSSSTYSRPSTVSSTISSNNIQSINSLTSSSYNTPSVTRNTRNIDKKYKDMQDVKSAWYNYFRKMKAYEVKYKGDKELKRFKKEVVAANINLLSPTLKSILYEVRSPQLVQDQDVEGDHSQAFESQTQIYSTQQQKPKTLQSTGVSLKSSVPKLTGNIGPGYTYAPHVSPSSLYPKEVEEVLATAVTTPIPSNPFTRTPTAEYVQKRPVFKSHHRLKDREPRETKEHEFVDISEIGETFDIEADSISQYKHILTPKELKLKEERADSGDDEK